MESSTPYKDARVAAVRKVSERMARHLEEHTTEEDAIKGVKILFIVVLCEYLLIAGVVALTLAYLTLWLLGTGFWISLCGFAVAGLVCVKKRLEHEGVTFSFGVRGD